MLPWGFARRHWSTPPSEIFAGSGNRFPFLPTAQPGGTVPGSRRTTAETRFSRPGRRRVSPFSLVHACSHGGPIFLSNSQKGYGDSLRWKMLGHPLAIAGALLTRKRDPSCEAPFSRPRGPEIASNSPWHGAGPLRPVVQRPPTNIARNPWHTAGIHAGLTGSAHPAIHGCSNEAVQHCGQCSPTREPPRRGCFCVCGARLGRGPGRCRPLGALGKFATSPLSPLLN